jgi:hypothetical protein
MKNVINKTYRRIMGLLFERNFKMAEQLDQTVWLQFMQNTSMGYICCRLSYRYCMADMTFGGTINFICQNKNQVGLYQGEELLLKIDSDPKLKACWFVSVNGCPAPPQIT